MHISDGAFWRAFVCLQVVHNLFASETDDRRRATPLATAAVNQDVLLVVEDDAFSLSVSAGLLDELDGYKKIFTVRAIHCMFGIAHACAVAARD